MILSSGLRAARAWAIRHFDVRRLVVRSSRPIISFTFDDFPRSAYRVGGAILNEHGVKGTYYVAMGLMNTETQRGPHFTTEDLECLVADGHELGCHTFGHHHACTTRVAKFEESLLRNRDHVARLLPDVKLDTFSYPFGGVTLSVKRMMSRYFTCCRGVYRGINSRVIDLNLLRANPLYSRSVEPDQIGGLIRANDDTRGWLIFYTHDVCDSPSPFGCTEEVLRQAVKWSVDSRAAVLPVKDAIAALAGCR